jgi:hypothetical protein
MLYWHTFWFLIACVLLIAPRHGNMNIAHANTEAAVSYKIRRVGLDRQIRIAAVAHTLLGRLVEGAHGDRVLGALYGEMTQFTRPVLRVPGAAIGVRDAAQRSVALSVAAVHADFEWACRDLLTDALEFWESSFVPNLGKGSLGVQSVEFRFQ